PEEDKQHLKAVGIPVDEVKEAADRVYGAVTELGTLAGRARAVWGLMLTGGDAIPALKLAAVVAAVGLLVALLVSWKSESMGVVLGLAGQVAGVVGGMARWVGKNAASVSAALEPLERLRTQLDTSLKKAEQEKARKIAELDKRLERVKTAYADAARNLDEAERKVQAAKMGVNEALSGRLITRFIEQRVASNDYRKHLGIVAMIRDDFATLSNMIGEHNTAQLKQEPGVPDGLTEPTLATESVKAPKDLGINRIILYIDDLDRCRPERVVEVLQAIHLLLAFPLFAVVVGVDARWLSSSLQSQYQHMLIPPEPAGGNGNGSSNSQAPQQSASAATPDDYLEKIFQVPYWIKHMEDKACRDLINSLVERDLETREDQQVDAKPSPALTKPIVGGEPIEKPSTLQPKKSTATTPKTRTTTADISPEDLRLDEAEVEAMKQLSLIIGRSPRVAKRFVNTYRLIKAALPPDERDAFVGLRGETGTFRYPMLLLAVATGTPDLAPYFFHQICRPNRDRPFGELGAAVTTAPTRDGVAEVKRLREFLDSADSEPFKSLPAGELARWVGRVAQFSFDVGGGLRSGLSEVGGPTISMP
ncbi:MAG: hypothetical protein KAV82_00590, partial [Phycisphaerae bacterium]|nr:hypothetical protein [Phycisphaerae bacterium]